MRQRCRRSGVLLSWLFDKRPVGMHERRRLLQRITSHLPEHKIEVKLTDTSEELIASSAPPVHARLGYTQAGHLYRTWKCVRSELTSAGMRHMAGTKS
jgi:hypothetical protein